jgi:hypothetical protein
MLKHVGSYHVGETWESDCSNYEVIAAQPGKGGVWFIVRMTMKESGEVFDYATIVLISRDRKEFCWKPVSEFSGPYETSMPKALFNRLTSLGKLPEGEDPSYADDWRKRQQAVYERQRFDRVQVPKPGDVIVFRDPICFKASDTTCEVTRFSVREWGKKRRLIALAEGQQHFNAKLSRSVWSYNPFVVEGRATMPAANPAATLATSPAPVAQQQMLF